MHQSALLLLTGPLRVVAESMGRYLNFATENVSKRLYVKLEPELIKPFSKSDSASLGRLSTVVPVVYQKASTMCKCLDVRVLLTNFRHSKLDCYKPPTFDVILTNSDADDQNINSYVDFNFDNKRCDIIKLSNLNTYDCKDLEVPAFKTYRTVCLGGTFDRLHNGHKVLLSEAILKATDNLIVGVSDVTMLQRKVLWELIEPVDKRIEEVFSFLAEVDPSLNYEVAPIFDPYGPTITNHDIDCLVVTTETKIGGDKVNSVRAKKGMHELPLCVIDLVENINHSPDEEEKLSSSTQRMHLLGTPLKEKTFLKFDFAFCALLQGHLASDKSYVANKFQALGMAVLCCDEILRATLNESQNFKQKFAQSFPNESLYSDGSLDFERLRILCLKNKDVKNWLIEFAFFKVQCALESLMWSDYVSEARRRVVIKDSTFFEGLDWKELDIQEIWAAILPPAECLKNLKEQHNLTEEEATDLFKFLPSNEHYVEGANIVFCNKWSSEATEEQVNKAFSYVKSVQDIEFLE